MASKHLAHPPTLIFTGATAGIKAFPNSATFAAGNFAKRALSQSLAKEFGPQGIHVSYAVIDGVIDIPKTKAWLNDVPDAKISPDAVSDQSYPPVKQNGLDADFLPKWTDCERVLAYPYATKDGVYVGD